MYFDAVIAGNGTVLFNGTPEETVKWIRENGVVLESSCYVVQGSTLKSHTLGEYLSL
jgi:hypothetical protein